jgi:hypothetical protein
VFSSCSKDENTLPTLLIKSDSEIKWDDRTGCYVYYITDCDTICWSGDVKYRGGISAKYPKHSYSLKLDKDYSVAGLPKGKNWILNASYIDKTFIRHKLCYDIFKNMGDYNIAPECTYVIVNDNGNPQGLYVVMQRLNKRTLQIDDSDDNALIFKEPKVFFADSVMPKKLYSDENFNEQTYPDFDKFGDKSAILDEFHEFILHSSDEEFKAEINDWIDMRNVVDWHLLLLCTNNSDGVRKNFYLYKKDSETPLRIALWDCDHSFGRDSDNEKNMLERLTDDWRNILFNRLLATTWYQKMLSERWKQLRDTKIISYRAIEKMIRENDKLVQKGLPENQSIWSYDSDFYYDDNNYEQEIDLMLDFIQLSLDTMDKRFGYGRK